jgi:hypothetical protein
MPFDTADEIRDWDVYAKTLKADLKKVRKKKKFVRYFKKFKYMKCGSKLDLPLLLVGKKSEADRLAKGLEKTAAKSEMSAPKEPGWGLIYRTGPKTLTLLVTRGRVVEMDLRRLTMKVRLLDEITLGEGSEADEASALADESAPDDETEPDDETGGGAEGDGGAPEDAVERPDVSEVRRAIRQWAEARAFASRGVKALSDRLRSSVKRCPTSARNPTSTCSNANS